MCEFVKVTFAITINNNTGKNLIEFFIVNAAFYSKNK